MQSIDLNEIAVFIHVVQAGSFTRAAKNLGMPNSTVSARVSSLERRLGITLLQRTTRQLSLTTVGKTYYEQCVLGLEEIRIAESSVTSNQSEPQGDLRISAPVFIGAELFPKIIAECSKKIPKVHIEVILQDRSIDFIAEKIDVALRMGKLNDSSLIAKKLGEIRIAAFAAPSYLKANGEPNHPKDLIKHSCIQFAPWGKEVWRFFNTKNSVSVPLSGKLIVDELHLVKNLAMFGSGIALLPIFVCKEESKKNRLVRVLPDWEFESRQIQLVHLPEKFPSPKLRTFMDIANRKIKDQISHVVGALS